MFLTVYFQASQMNVLHNVWCECVVRLDYTAPPSLGVYFHILPPICQHWCANEKAKEIIAVRANTM